MDVSLVTLAQRGDKGLPAGLRPGAGASCAKRSRIGNPWSTSPRRARGRRRPALIPTLPRVPGHQRVPAVPRIRRRRAAGSLHRAVLRSAPCRQDPVRPHLPAATTSAGPFHVPGPTRGAGYRPHRILDGAGVRHCPGDQRPTRRLVRACGYSDPADAGCALATAAPGAFPHIELVVVDEADRLKTTGLEQVRDLYDRHQFGLVLIGRPGLQLRLTRYPQLYSRVGFAHEYRPPGPARTPRPARPAPPQLGLEPRAGALDHPDALALAAIARITGGNFAPCSDRGGCGGSKDPGLSEPILRPRYCPGRGNNVAHKIQGSGYRGFAYCPVTGFNNVITVKASNDVNTGPSDPGPTSHRRRRSDSLRYTVAHDARPR